MTDPFNDDASMPWQPRLLRFQFGTSNEATHEHHANHLTDFDRTSRKIDPPARGEKVLLDADLARLYGVSTGALNRAVKRNASRFPPDLMFELTVDEVQILKCQTGISSFGHGGRRRSRPFAFTEQGVAMLSTISCGASVPCRRQSAANLSGPKVRPEKGRVKRPTNQFQA